MQKLTTQQLTSSFHELDQLARDEYHEPLAIIASSETDKADQLYRIGRLIGVVLKEPFATPQPHTFPSQVTRAYRSWDLNPSDQFYKASDTWQFRALQQIQSELRDWLGVPDSLYDMAQEAKNERGFFGFLALSCQKYICENAQLKRTLQEKVEAAKQDGVPVDLKNPASLVAAGGLALGGYLVSVIPVLGYVGAPVIAGVVLLIYTIGVDAFCEWSRQNATHGAYTEDH